MSSVDPTTQTTPYDSSASYDDMGAYDQPSVIVGADTLKPSPAVPMNYSDVAFPTTLALQVGATDEVLPVRSTLNYPAPPFQVSLDAGTNTQEVCLVQGVTPNSFTDVVRNYNGGGAFPHAPGAPVAHSTTSFDYMVLNHHVTDPSVDWHPQYLDTFRHADPDLHECGVTIGYAPPTNSQPGDVGQQGSSPYPALADHVHGRESWTAIMANAVPSGYGVFINLNRTDTFYWLQTPASAQPASHPYTSFTQTSTTIPTTSFQALEPSSATILGHVWNYGLVINPTFTFLRR